MSEKVDFLKTFGIFKHLNDMNLQRLLYYINEIQVLRGHVIYKSGQPVDGIYLVRKGEVEITKEINVKKQIESYLKRTRQTEMGLG